MSLLISVKEEAILKLVCCLLSALLKNGNIYDMYFIFYESYICNLVLYANWVWGARGAWFAWRISPPLFPPPPTLAAFAAWTVAGTASLHVDLFARLFRAQSACSRSAALVS